MTRVDWESLLWETRGYLGIEDTDPVPVGELLEQAQANGYDERETRRALRDTDALESVGTGADDLRVRLAEDVREDPEADLSNPGVDADGSRSSTPKTPNDDGFNQHADPEDPPVLVNDTEPEESVGTWSDADFSRTRSDTYPPELLGCKKWMGRLKDEKRR